MKNDNGKIDHIDKTYIDQDVDIETNIDKKLVTTEGFAR